MVKMNMNSYEHSKPNNFRQKWAAMNLDTSTAKSQWESIDWTTVYKRINKLQTRITKAAQRGNRNLVKKLQYLLTSSFFAKLSAVRHVTTNKGKNTPGIDNQLWKSPSDKYKAALSLETKGYKATPLKRSFIDKKGKKKKRPLGIPIKYDRAIQSLHSMALDPIAEVTADNASFGFRKKRGIKDAASHIFSYSAKTKVTQWILEGDIKGCFDNINHQWLRENIPMDKKILKQLLKAGFIYKRELFPTQTGTPQGGIISPILANMTLDGIEKKIKEKYWSNGKGTIDARHNKHRVNYTRYADDFIVSADAKEHLLDIKEIITQHLTQRGLALSDEKTLITNLNDGFDFLGWNFRKYNGTMLTKPSKDSFNSVVEKLKTVIRGHRGRSQTQLIKALNPIITGWAYNHRNVCAKRTYVKLDGVIFKALWKWAKRRHSNKSRKWIKNRYWTRTLFRDWIFSDGNIKLKHASETKIIRHKIIKFEANPYLPEFRSYYYYRDWLRMQGTNKRDVANGIFGE